MGPAREKWSTGERTVPVSSPRVRVPASELRPQGPSPPNVSLTGTLSRQKARIRSPHPGSGPTNYGSVGLQCCLSFPFGKLIYHLPENLLAKSSESLSYKRSL